MKHVATLLPLLSLFLAGCGNGYKENPAWPIAKAHLLTLHSGPVTEVGKVSFLSIESVESEVESCVATEQHVTFVALTKVTLSDRRRLDPPGLYQMGGDFLPNEIRRYRDEVVLVPREGAWQIYPNSCKPLTLK